MKFSDDDKRRADAELQQALARVLTIGLAELGEADPDALRTVNAAIDEGAGRLKAVAWFQGRVEVYLVIDGQEEVCLFSIARGDIH